MVDSIIKGFEVWTQAQGIKSKGRVKSIENISLEGVSHLRELIIELAVQGKLVPQNLEDEPASILVRGLKENRRRLVEEGKIPKQAIAEKDAEDSYNFNLPTGWERVRLGDIAYPQPGFAFKSSQFNQNNAGLPIIRIRDVGQEFSGTYYFGEYRDEFLIEKGDYLISMDGEFRVAPWQNKTALLNQRVSRLVFYSSEVSKKFVADSLQARLSELQGIKAYTTVDHLSGKQIYNSWIGLPPLSEQKRIVAKVDELMALCDELEKEQTNNLKTHQTLVKALLETLTLAKDADELQAAWQRMSAHFDTLFCTEDSIDQLKQSILQLAIMGRLVKQDPNDEPASELIIKIEKKKANLIGEGKLKREKALPEITKDEISYELPKGWAWCRLGNILRVLNGRAYKMHEMLSSGMPLLRVGNLFTSNEWYYSDLELEPDKYIDTGDLIYAWSASFGPFIWKGEKAIYHYHIWKLDFFDAPSYNKMFMYLYLSSVTQKIKASGNGIAMLHMTKERMEKLLVPIPPLKEQQFIVAKVDELMNLCDRLLEKVKKSQDIQILLSKTIIQNATA